MLAKLLGSQGLDFTADGGVHIKGTNIYVAYADKNVTGLKSSKFFVKEDVDIPEGVKIGDQISIFFDHRGKVEAIVKKDK